MGLTEAVEASDALLDLHRVPRQVVVQQDVAELEVQPLRADLGRQEDPATGIGTELLYHPAALVHRDAPVDDADAMAALAELHGQVLERAAEEREHQRLARRILG